MASSNETRVKIYKIGVIGAVSIAAVAAVCYFIFPIEIFLAVAIGGLISFIGFIATLLVYYKLDEVNSSNALKHILVVFFGKLIFFALIFYLLSRIENLDLLSFFISFLIFFTIFLNIEILLIYKRILFKR